MDDEAFRDHVLTDLHDLAAAVAELRGMVGNMYAEFEQARPLLRMLSPGNGVSDVTRAGLIRGMRKAARRDPNA